MCAERLQARAGLKCNACVMSDSTHQSSGEMQTELVLPQHAIVKIIASTPSLICLNLKLSADDFNLWFC